MENSYIEKIERFLSGQMDAAEKEAFENELQENEDLQKELSAYLLAQEVVEKEIENELKEKMEEWELPPRGNSPKLGLISIILICLTALALISVVWVCPAQQQQDWEQYAMVNIDGMERSRALEEETKLLNQYYLTGNYEAASQLIRKMDEEDRNKPAVQFIDALILYQNDKFAEALERFAMVKENEEAHFSVKEQSAYFYLLTLARMDECGTECRESLNRIANDPNHLRQREAALLMNELSERGN